MTESIEELAQALASARGWSDQLDALSRVQALIASGEEATALFPAIRELLHAADEWTAEEAAKTLGLLGDARAVEPLCALLPREPPQLPSSSSESPQAFYAAAVVASEQDSVEHAAIEALGALGSAKALPSLMAVVEAPWVVERNREAARRVIAMLREREPGAEEGSERE